MPLFYSYSDLHRNIRKVRSVKFYRNFEPGLVLMTSILCLGSHYCKIHIWSTIAISVISAFKKERIIGKCIITLKWLPRWQFITSKECMFNSLNTLIKPSIEKARLLWSQINMFQHGLKSGTTCSISFHLLKDESFLWTLK